MPLLTIGILTYNRSGKLEKLLDRIIPTCDALGIEILVSDNCSPDNTPKMMEKYKNVKCLRYIRNATNLGFDGNLLSVTAKASGEFLWWMGDDDIPDAQQLANIKCLLEENPAIDLFFVGYMHDLPRNKHRTSGTTLNCETLSAQQYADRYMHKATLISTNILNLAAARRLQINQACMSKGWVNLHLLLLLVDQIKSKDGQVVVIKNPVVIQGMDEERVSVNKWEKTFVNYFNFTLGQTPLRSLSIARLKKHFYDINVRPKYLTLTEILEMNNPLEFNCKIIEIFRPNVFAQLSFWLQYFISRILRVRRRQ